MEYCAITRKFSRQWRRNRHYREADIRHLARRFGQQVVPERSGFNVLAQDGSLVARLVPEEDAKSERWHSIH